MSSVTNHWEFIERAAKQWSSISQLGFCRIPLRVPREIVKKKTEIPLKVPKILPHIAPIGCNAKFTWATNWPLVLFWFLVSLYIRLHLAVQCLCSCRLVKQPPLLLWQVCKTILCVALWNKKGWKYCSKRLDSWPRKRLRLLTRLDNATHLPNGYSDWKWSWLSSVYPDEYEDVWNP